MLSLQLLGCFFDHHHDLPVVEQVAHRSVRLLFLGFADGAHIMVVLAILAFADDFDDLLHVEEAVRRALGIPHRDLDLVEGHVGLDFENAVLPDLLPLSPVDLHF